MGQFMFIPEEEEIIVVLPTPQVWYDAADWAGSGTQLDDLSGNLNHNTLFNTPSYSTNYGGSVIFDGVDQYAQKQLVDFTVTSGQMTQEIWVRPITNLTTTWGMYMMYHNQQGAVGPGNRCFLGLRYPGSIGLPNEVYTTCYQVGSTEERSTSYYQSLNNWFHYVVARDNTDTRFYINGVLYDTQSADFTITDSWWPDINLSIGLKDSASGYMNFQNTITRMYESKLDATDVLNLFNDSKGRHGL